jgi:hypothetical protein
VPFHGDIIESMIIDSPPMIFSEPFWIIIQFSMSGAQDGLVRPGPHSIVIPVWPLLVVGQCCRLGGLFESITDGTRVSSCDAH